jgi:hypothetical protein
MRHFLEIIITFSLIAILAEINFKILINQSSEIFYFSGFISGIVFLKIYEKIHGYFKTYYI